MAKTDNINGLLNMYDLAGKKICIHPLISNDEIGRQCIIVVMDLHDNNDISDVLYKTRNEKARKLQNKLVSFLYNTNDDKLKNKIVEDLNTLDWVSMMAEKESQEKGVISNTKNKCRGFTLSIKPNSKIELKRIDTDEDINIENINGLFDILKDEKYDFIY